MGVVQLKKIDFKTLTPILTSSFEGKLYHNNKYAYKLLHKKVRISSEKIITLLQKDHLKFLVDILHLIKKDCEYMGYIMPYLKDYINLLEATKDMPFEKRIKILDIMGEFFHQFDNKPYIYGDIHADNILIKPNGRSNMLKFIDIDSIIIRPEKLFLLDDEDIDEYFGFDIMNCDLCDTESCYLDEDDNQYSELLKVCRDIATLSLTILSDYDWKSIFDTTDSSYSLNLLHQTYHDIELTNFFQHLFCKKTKFKNAEYFSDNMKQFDLKRIYHTSIK